MALLRLGLIIFLSLSLLLLPSKSFSKRQWQKERGDSLVIGDFIKPSPINPILTRGTISATLRDIIFDGLIKISAQLAVQPNLALSWNNSPDGLHWQFHLEKNIRFHDGIELTAEDVKFTLDSILDPTNNSPYLTLLEGVKKVDAKDKYQVEIVLKYPIASFLSYLDVGILPKHLLQGKDITKDEFNYYPIGTGPFKFGSWSGNEIILEANEQYFLGRPQLEKVIAKIFPTQSIVWAQLMKRDLDLIFLAFPKNYRIIERIADFRVHSLLSLYSYILVFNNDNGLFKEIRVRQALNYAVNKEEMIKRTLLGRGRVSSGTIYPLSWAYDPNLKPYPYDARKALELLYGAGWSDTNGDNILDRSGRRFEFALLIVKGDEVSWKTALQIQQQLLDIGIIVKVKPLPFPQYENFLLAKKFDAALISIISDDPDKNYAWWHSSQIIGGFNVFSYKNKNVDDALDRGRTSLDREERGKIYQQLQRKLHEDPPGVFLFWRDYLIGIHKRFKGIRLSPARILNNINEWYVPREEQKYR
jgi:peptide/nickel transport system substrate-binding protein